MNKKYSANYNFFKTWSPKMAWVLGFIASDGNITYNKQQHSLRFCQTDKDLLEKVKRALDSNHRIYEFKKLRATWNTPYGLQICNKNMCQDLINLKITPRKSLTLEMPIVPDKFLRHFVRGYVDGNGCIRSIKHEEKTRISYSLAIQINSGSKKFLEQLKLNLKKFGFNLSVRPTRNIFVVTIGGLKFGKWLYRDKEDWYSEKKFNKYKQILGLIQLTKKNPYPQTMIKPAFE